jgi:hypothetical protein
VSQLSYFAEASDEGDAAIGGAAEALEALVTAMLAKDKVAINESSISDQSAIKSRSISHQVAINQPSSRDQSAIK